MNFKNIIDDIKALITKHKQVKGFGVGDIKQLSYYITQNKEADGTIQENTTKDGKSPRFPLVYVIPQPVIRDRRTISYPFNILVMDILSRDFSNEVDVWSDTLQIAEDIVSQFGYGVTAAQGSFYDRYDIQTPMNILPFSESYDDYVNGWNLNLTIVVDEPINRCDAPFESFDECETTTQFLQVTLNDNTKFKLILWEDSEFSNPTNALCDYEISGTATGSLGTIFTGTEIILDGQHQHQFNLKDVLLPGEVVVDFEVTGYSTPNCECPVVLKY